MTGAFKYWMYKTFMVSTGDDPEGPTDEPSSSPRSGTSSVEGSGYRQEFPNRAQESNPLISDPQRRRLMAIAGARGMQS